MKKIINTLMPLLGREKIDFSSEVKNSHLNRILFRHLIKYLRGVFIFGLEKKSSIIFIDRNCRFSFRNKISLGKNFRLGRGSELSGLSIKGMNIGNNVSIGDYSKLICSTQLNNPGIGIRLEDNVGIGEFAYIGGAGGVIIKKNTITGQYLSIHPENHLYGNSEVLIRLQGTTREGIEIGENCWIGSKVTILDGVIIGNNCVIAAGSVVTKSFPCNSIIGGVPAKNLKE